MRVFNKYILVAMNPKSTEDELLKNMNDHDYNAYLIYYNEDYDDVVEIFNIYDIVVSAYAFYVASSDVACVAYDSDSLVDVACNYADSAKDYRECLNKYFEKSEENIQDYYDEIDRINKEDKKNERVK